MKDLRLNNWILLKNEPIQVKAIDYDEYKSEPFVYIINGRNHNCFEGIPLDNEWLVKLGFASTGLQWYKNFVSLSILRLINDQYIYYYGHREMKYVHQLQNLYYELTGDFI